MQAVEDRSDLRAQAGTGADGAALDDMSENVGACGDPDQSVAQGRPETILAVEGRLGLVPHRIRPTIGPTLPRSDLPPGCQRGIAA
jgi:hypothetical protein